MKAGHLVGGFNCSVCGRFLKGGPDTYGPLARPLCQRCFLAGKGGTGGQGREGGLPLEFPDEARQLPLGDVADAGGDI